MYVIFCEKGISVTGSVARIVATQQILGHICKALITRDPRRFLQPLLAPRHHPILGATWFSLSGGDPFLVEVSGASS